jgi:uncharacterized protein
MTTEVEAKRLRRVRRLVATALVLLAFGIAWRVLTAPGHAVVLLGRGTLQCTVAVTPEQRSWGLQGRKSLPYGQGMLFVQPQPEETAMSMKDVPFPIEVAFVDAGLHVTKIASMQPDGLRDVTSNGAVLYVVEVAPGWLASNSVAVGSSLGFTGEAPVGR